MKVNGNAIKVGNVIQHDGGLWVAVKTAHVKPGKGGAFAQVELKNLIDGRKLNERFRSSDTVERVTLEQKQFQYLYEQGEALVFMDQKTFDQIELQKDFVGEDQVRFLHDGMVVSLEFHEERPIGIELPESVVLEVVETEPTVKGQTASSSYKPAKASNGMRIMIPPYMGEGERILVSTETGEYMRRADYSGVTTPTALVKVMAAAARKAGRALARDFGEVTELQVSKKGAADYVSAADLKAEQTLYEELLRARPGYGFLGEERGMIEGTDKTHTWIVDPLDGTTNFLHAMPHFAINIALQRDGQIVAGVTYNPANSDLFWTERGRGAYLNDRRLRVAARTRFEEAVIATGIPFMGHGQHGRFLKELHQITQRVSGVRRFGAAALDLAWVAAGRFDGFWERDLNIWDMAAGVLLIAEAGGTVTDADGGDDPLAAGSICAANSELHPALLERLKAAN